MKKLLLQMLMLCALGAVLAGAGAWWLYSHYVSSGPLLESKTVIIKKGLGFEGIATLLNGEGVIAHSVVFKVAAALNGDAPRFKAGEYEFPAGISVREAIRMISEGRVVIHKITVPEGFTVAELSELLMKEPMLEGELPPNIPEGSLLPETYHFTYGDTRADLIGRMQQSMRQVVQELWATRKEGLPITTPHEALTLASIVEKETGVPEEHARVAAVYINRLNLGMKLQADPTVAYGITQGAKMERPLTLKDLETPTPYNTYTNTGLPPSPIANPGRASIEAALNPADTKDLFFVATGKGGHTFAATLAEHNKNVAVYRARMKEAKANP